MEPKRFFKKITIFLLILYFFSYTLGKVIDAGLEKTPRCQEWEDIFEARINADLLIQGSSRARVHISPKTIEDKLHISAYNLGIDGHPFLMQYYRFRSYIQSNNKQPKYIIQTVEMDTLERRKTLYGLGQFIPYIDKPVIREAVSFFEGFETEDYYLPLFKYRHSIKLIGEGIKAHIYPVENYKYKGFRAQERDWDDSFAKFKAKYPYGVYRRIDPLTNNLFADFLRYCHDNQIEVILVYPPEYVGAQRLTNNRNKIVAFFKSYSQKYGLVFLDYSDSYISINKNYFYNSQHLNSKGVDEFNDILVADLKKILTPDHLY